MELNAINIGYCEMSADLFVQSARKGYDSKDFIEKLMNSQTAAYLYHKDYTEMWRGSSYIIETLEAEQPLLKGPSLPEDILSWIGYLFECWKLTYPDDSAKDILKQAPIDTLLLSYQGLHVMTFEDAIGELKEIARKKVSS
jgi:hypothetical protein